MQLLVFIIHQTATAWLKDWEITSLELKTLTRGNFPRDPLKGIARLKIIVKNLFLQVFEQTKNAFPQTLTEGSCGTVLLNFLKLI